MTDELIGRRATDPGRPARPDGRRQRSERSRAAIVDALLELLREGRQPSSTEIAERAGCTQRTVFNHFSDMDELLGAVAMAQAERVLSLLPQPGTGSFEQRAHDYAEAMARLLEETMHVRWAVLVGGQGTVGGLDVRRATHDVFRANLSAAFEPELSRRSDDELATTLNALDVVTDAAVWRIRRLQHGQTRDEARAAIEATLLAVLG